MHVPRHLSVCLSTLLLVACGAGDAPATPESESAPVDEKAERAVEVREAVLKLMYENYGPMGNMARDRAPFDLAAVRKNSKRLGQLVRMLGDSFVYDTRGSGVETEALDVIWVDGEAFAAKIDNLVAAADALESAAQGGDEALIKSAVGDVGKACGSCHDDFREDDD